MAAKRKDRNERGAPGRNASAGPGSHGAGGGPRRAEESFPGKGEESFPGSHFEGEFDEESWTASQRMRDTSDEIGEDEDSFSEYRPRGGYGFGSRLRRSEEDSGER